MQYSEGKSAVKTTIILAKQEKAIARKAFSGVNFIY